MDRRVMLMLVCLLPACTSGSHEERAAMPAELPLAEFGDSAEVRTLPAGRLPVESARPAARATLTQVAPSRDQLEPPLPDAVLADPPAAPTDERSRDGLAISEDLKPPIARAAAPFVLRGTRRGWVELDVRVAEDGGVTDAEYVAGEADSATVVAALDAAFALRYWPAEQRGVPVAVWCRLRFDVRR